MKTSNMRNIRPIEILLVDDSPGDVRLTIEAFKGSSIKNKLHIARDGIEAMEFLRQKQSLSGLSLPDLILLDLNMPRMNGREVLSEIKADKKLRLIPVCVLSTSDADSDILESYSLYANSYITKPVDIDEFAKIVTAIESFWLSIAQLPTLVQKASASR